MQKRFVRVALLCALACGLAECGDGETLKDLGTSDTDGRSEIQEVAVSADCGDGPCPFDANSILTDCESCPSGVCVGSTVCIEFVPVPGGSFYMGCDPQQPQCDMNAQPKHWVSVEPFEMMPTEVTEAQWAAVMPDIPARGCEIPRQGSGEYPMSSAPNWMAVNTFCERLGGRLPTEAEWEYAARAGSTSPFVYGDTYESTLEHESWSNDGKEPYDEWLLYPVAQKLPNAFGLFDMLGNVSEIVRDCCTDNYLNAPDYGYPPVGPFSVTGSQIVRGAHGPYTPPVPVYWRTPTGRMCPSYGTCCSHGIRCVRDVAGSTNLLQRRQP